MSHSIFKTLIQTSSLKYADRPLLYDTLENRLLNYTECRTLINLVSKKLALSGYTKGDIILNFSPLSLESVILCWACLLNGLIFVPVDHNWPSSLLKQILNETSPKMVMTDQVRLSMVAPLITSEIIVLSELTEQTQIPTFYDWLEDLNNANTNVIDEINPDDPAIILYTSGSTGTPKGVMLSQKALCNSGKLVSDHFDWQCSDSFMNLGDLNSMSGLRNTCIAPLHSGSSMVIAQPDERNSVLHIIELIYKLQIQYIGVAPTVIRQMNIIYSQARKDQIASLKAILCTGGSLAKDQMQLFYTLYSKPIYNYYGLTETAGICSGHNVSTFSPNDNSIGKPIGAEFIIIPDASSKSTDIGELLVKSNNLMLGYFKKEKETAEVLINGYFHTGDIAQRRIDGFYELLGRKKNTIKNIYSELIHLEEIDRALEAHHLIKEACSCNFASFIEDEKIIAFIVLEEYTKDEENIIINDIRNHMLNLVGKNRTPWRYYIEKDLPRNTNGKIQRQKLEEKINEYIQSEHTRYY